MPSEQSCSVTEYLNGEEEVPVCVDLDGGDWETNFLAQLGSVGGDEDVEDADKGDQMDEEPVHKITTFSAAVKALDDVKDFLDSRGCYEEANTVSSAGDMVAAAHILAMKQTTLCDFLVPATCPAPELS